MAGAHAGRVPRATWPRIRIFMLYLTPRASSADTCWSSCRTSRPSRLSLAMPPFWFPIFAPRALTGSRGGPPSSRRRRARRHRRPPGAPSWSSPAAHALARATGSPGSQGLPVPSPRRSPRRTRGARPRRGSQQHQHASTPRSPRE